MGVEETLTDSTAALQGVTQLMGIVVSACPHTRARPACGAMSMCTF